MANRLLIRIFPWIFAISIVGIIYFLLRQQMHDDLQEAKLSLRQIHVEDQILNLGKMELMHYRFKDVLFYQSLKPYLDKDYNIPDTEPIAIVKGVAIVGIDFHEVDVDDFKFSNDSTLLLILPKPRLFDFSLENEVQLITDFDITSEEVTKAALKLADSEDRSHIDPIQIDIKYEHVAKILDPVLENMTKERITIEFHESGD